jgi:hypothetical protein
VPEAQIYTFLLFLLGQGQGKIKIKKNKLTLSMVRELEMELGLYRRIRVDPPLVHGGSLVIFLSKEVIAWVNTGGKR